MQGLSLNKDQCQKLMDILMKVNEEQLLIMRLIYKMKNQMGKQKQYQYLQEIKKFIQRKLLQGFQKRKDNHIGIDKINEKYCFPKQIELEYFEDLINKLGEALLGMIQLKLHISYVVLVLGVISRLRIVIDNLKMVILYIY